jgi:hypothetical protein
MCDLGFGDFWGCGPADTVDYFAAQQMIALLDFEQDADQLAAAHVELLLAPGQDLELSRLQAQTYALRQGVRGTPLSAEAVFDVFFHARDSAGKVRAAQFRVVHKAQNSGTCFLPHAEQKKACEE